MMADQDTVTDGDSTLILKTAAGIDENVFAEVDISPEIGIKRRKHGTVFTGGCDYFSSRRER